MQHTEFDVRNDSLLRQFQIIKTESLRFSISHIGKLGVVNEFALDKRRTSSNFYNQPKSESFMIARHIVYTLIMVAIIKKE